MSNIQILNFQYLGCKIFSIFNLEYLAGQMLKLPNLEVSIFPNQGEVDDFSKTMGLAKCLSNFTCIPGLPR